MRLDAFLLKIGTFDSRTKAKQAIERGEIFINYKPINKSAYNVDENNPPDIKYVCSENYVSLGGYKLKKALNDFKFSVENMVVADIGASTGGFTDCLLKNGAKKVYSVDLNDDLLHKSLKQNSKVFRIIKNARQLKAEDFDESLDLIVADLSFISITYLFEIFSNLLSNGAFLITLIKPQFESGVKKRFKNGIIRDKKIHLSVCQTVLESGIKNNLSPIAFTTAPINEDKNLEFLMLFEKNGQVVLKKENLNFFLNSCF